MFPVRILLFILVVLPTVRNAEQPIDETSFSEIQGKDSYIQFKDHIFHTSITNYYFEIRNKSEGEAEVEYIIRNSSAPLVFGTTEYYWGTNFIQNKQNKQFGRLCRYFITLKDDELVRVHYGNANNSSPFILTYGCDNSKCCGLECCIGMEIPINNVNMILSWTILASFTTIILCCCVKFACTTRTTVVAPLPPPQYVSHAEVPNAIEPPPEYHSTVSIESEEQSSKSV